MKDERLERFDQRMALPLILSAVLPIVVAPGSTNSYFAATINIVAWIVFVIDLTVHMRLRPHYLSSWMGRFDLFVVILTAPWFLIIGPSESKLVLLARLARIGRLVVASKGLRVLFERLGRVAIFAGGIVIFASLVAYYAEHPDNPEYETVGDAMWWGVVTLTTVGYGDIVPETPAGRLAGVMIMFTGIGVLGVLAGSLASFFKLETEESGDTGAETPPPTAADLAREITALREQVAILSEHLSRFEDREP